MCRQRHSGLTSSMSEALNCFGPLWLSRAASGLHCFTGWGFSRTMWVCNMRVCKIPTGGGKGRSQEASLFEAFCRLNQSVSLNNQAVVSFLYTFPVKAASRQ